MIKAIIFDCFGVLTTDRWKEFVATLPEDQRPAASDLNHALDSGLISRPEFLRQVQALTGHRPTEVENSLDSDIVEDKNLQLLEYIGQLKVKYKIGMISNVSSNWVRDKFLTTDEAKLFDDFVLSFEVRIIKPNPQIFQIAAERLAVELNECVFVDDIERYSLAAAEAGMRGITYDNFQQMKTDLQNILAKS